MKARRKFLWVGLLGFLVFNPQTFLLFPSPLLHANPLLSYSPYDEIDTTTVAFSPDGKYILSAGFYGDIRLWKTGRCDLQVISFILDPHLLPTDPDAHAPHLSVLKGITSLIWSPNGENFVIGIRDRTVRLYSIATKSERIPWPHEEEVFENEYQLGVRAVTYSSDGQFIASGGHDGHVFIWDAEGGEPSFRRLCCHKGWVNALDFSLDGKFLVSGSSDGTVKIWEASSGKLVRSFDVTHEVYSVTYSPDVKTIAASSENGKESYIYFWDQETGAQIRKFSHPGGSWSIRFSPDGHFLASGGHWDGKIMIWDVSTGKLMQTLTEPESRQIRSLSYSPDGQFLISGVRSGPLPLWDLKAGKIVREFGKCPN